MAVSKSEKSENITAKDENEFCNCNVIHEDVVNYVRERMLEQMQFEKLSMFFKAISDETRIKNPLLAVTLKNVRVRPRRPARNDSIGNLSPAESITAGRACSQ